MDLGKILFGKYPPERRRKEMWNLSLGLSLGVIVCVVFGLIIFILYKQGRF